MIFACADCTIGITLPPALRDDPILSNLGNSDQKSDRHINLDILVEDDGTFAIKFGSHKIESGFKRGALLRHVLTLLDETFGINTLNASAIAMHGRAALFVGYGKSSIAAWLIEKGFTYVTDQKISLGEKLCGLAGPLQFPTDGAQHLAALPDFGSAPMAKLGDNFYIAPKPEWHTPQPVNSGVVVFLNYIEGAKLHLEKINAPEAIALLRDNQTGIDDAALTRLAHHTPTITLTYSNFEQLDGVLDHLLRLALGNTMSPLAFDKFVSFMPQAPVPLVTKFPIPARSDRVINCKLTIGMATYDDYDGVYFSIQSIRLFHPEILDDVEFVIIDNHPDGPCAEELKKLESAIPNLRYIPVNDVVGTTIKERVFTEANGEFVLCMDCHVMFAPGSLKRLLDYFIANPNTIDLHHGPMVSDDLKTLTTQWKTDKWSSGMLGKWHTDPRGLSADNPPFEIEAHGMGIFACRKAIWPSFNADFRGFGGEEVYMHGKFRARGGKILCLPFLIWLHRFGRPMGIKYPNNWEDRIRNALIGFDELGWDTTDMIAHFQELLGKDIADKAIADVYAERGWPPKLAISTAIS